MEWYLAVLKKYAVFTGRARRKEYWMFFLVNLVITLALSIVDNLIGSQLLGSVYSLAVVIPTIAVTVRRMHDTGRSGWWVLIGFIPLVGLLAILFFAAAEGTPGSNDYGPNPKEEGVLS
ncbi:DUF805 domain-containing protein [Thaumasiovibrio sp. DFM-14]|uniref:DUF805 domain-containing protein n=1 Tax=Thaumasiovibrio sp. DFM-14 TaxID=3384792 RepID=UPI0039A3015A